MGFSVQYSSDSEPDLKLLEDCIGAGCFGKMADIAIHEATKDLKVLRSSHKAARKFLPSSVSSRFGESVLKRKHLLPTRYDSPTQSFILSSLVERVKASALGLGLEISNFPHVSCLPTGRVNAYAVKLPSASREFLLFDSQLFLFCHLFAKAYAGCLPVQKSKHYSFSLDCADVSKHISTGWPVLRLCDILHAFGVLGRPGLAQQYSIDVAQTGLAHILREGMEIFLVAHEFGHIHANHLNEGASPQSNESSVLNAGLVQEHEADALALVLTMMCLRKDGVDAPMACIGVFLLFKSLALAKKYRYLVERGDDKGFVDLPESNSHPSNTERIQGLKVVIKELIPDQSEAIIKLTEQYNEVLELVWENMKRLRQVKLPCEYASEWAT